MWWTNVYFLGVACLFACYPRSLTAPSPGPRTRISKFCGETGNSAHQNGKQKGARLNNNNQRNKNVNYKNRMIRKAISRLAVRGIGPSSTKDDVLKFFSKFGKITQAHVLYDRDTGESTGEAFVWISSAGANAVSKNPNLKLGNYKLDIALSPDIPFDLPGPALREPHLPTPEGKPHRHTSLRCARLDGFA